MHQILTCQKIYCSVFTRPLHLTSAFNNDMAPSQQGRRSHLKFWGEKGRWDGGLIFNASHSVFFQQFWAEMSQVDHALGT